MLVAGIVLGTSLFAQAPPNFTGTWRLAAGPDGQPGDPAVLTITQTASEVRMGPPWDQSPDGLSIKLDGTESRNTLRGPGTPIEVSSKATLDGPRLVVADTVSNSRGVLTVKSVYALDGDRLTLQVSGTGQNGAPMPARMLAYTRGQDTAPLPLPPPPERSVEPGYTTLFNGRELTDWKIGGPVESFAVDRGAIVAHGAASHLSTTDRFAITRSGTST